MTHGTTAACYSGVIRNAAACCVQACAVEDWRADGALAGEHPSAWHVQHIYLLVDLCFD